MIFNTLILAIPPEFKSKMLSFNIEYIMVEEIISCFCTFFHFEAWARIVDYLVGSCFSDPSTDPLVYLLAVAIQIILDNQQNLNVSQSATEFSAMLKVYGIIYP